MLRRDLHDGMGPALAGVGLGLAAAAAPADARPRGHARSCWPSSRPRWSGAPRTCGCSLAPCSRPSSTTATWNAPSSVLADRFRASGLAGRGRHEPRRTQLDTRHQIAVYHVAAEALMNAYRHAARHRGRARRRGPEDGGVELEVVDDGAGTSRRPGGRRRAAVDAGAGRRARRASSTVAARTDGPGHPGEDGAAMTHAATRAGGGRRRPPGLPDRHGGAARGAGRRRGGRRGRHRGRGGRASPPSSAPTSC